MATVRTHKKLSTARKYSKGEPILRVGRSDGLYITGMGELDEVSIVRPDGAITGNVILKHLDRLGNANHAVAAHPYTTQPFAYDHHHDNIIGLKLTKAEAVQLWAHLDAALAGQFGVLDEVSMPPLKWIRQRLAVATQALINRTKTEVVPS